MKNKTVILLCICFTVVFNAASYIFMWKYDNRYNKIKDFYSSEIMEDEELIESIYNNHGLFKFLYLKNRPEEEILARYFGFYEFYFDKEHLSSTSYEGEYDEAVVIECFELSKDGQYDAFPYLENSFKLNAVISGPAEMIDKMFKYKSLRPVDESDYYSFSENWSVDFHGTELDKCETDIGSVIYAPVDKLNTVWRTQRKYFIFISKPIDGKKYVYMSTNKLGWTVDVPYRGEYE